MPLTVKGKIVIDGEGDGDWIMEHVGGYFVPGFDHTFARHTAKGRMLGGFALCGFMGKSITFHAAGGAPGWASRTLIWMAMHYAFVQLECNKLIALVRSDNYYALAQDFRLGFKPEAIIRDAHQGAHMLVLTMTQQECPWLVYEPRGWRSGH